MRLVELLSRIETLHGQSVQLEGNLIAVFERGTYLPFLCAGNRLRRTNHVRIQQPFAELRRIIQPMSLHLLRLERGYMTDKPYLYNFPVTLRATCFFDRDEEIPVLRDISEVHLRIPYPPRLRTLVEASEWEYRAQVDYTPLNNLEAVPEYRANITYSKLLHFATARPDVAVLHDGEARYARQILSKTLQIPGELHFGSSYSILRTDALRASVLPRPAPPASIWMPSSPQDRVIKICGGMNPLLYADPVRATITGKIRYLRTSEPDAPNGTGAKLVFWRIYSMELQGEGTLRHRHPQPQLI